MSLKQATQIAQIAVVFALVARIGICVWDYFQRVADHATLTNPAFYWASWIPDLAIALALIVFFSVLQRKQGGVE